MCPHPLPPNILSVVYHIYVEVETIMYTVILIIQLVTLAITLYTLYLTLKNRGGGRR